MKMLILRSEIREECYSASSRMLVLVCVHVEVPGPAYAYYFLPFDSMNFLYWSLVMPLCDRWNLFQLDLSALVGGFLGSLFVARTVGAVLAVPLMFVLEPFLVGRLIVMPGAGLGIVGGGLAGRFDLVRGGEDLVLMDLSSGR